MFTSTGELDFFVNVFRTATFVTLQTLIMNPYLITILATFIIYVFLIVAILIFGRKELSQLSVTDLIFILLISNAVQNAMVNGDWKSLWMGMVAAGTLFILNYLLKIIMYKSDFFSKLVEGEPVLLVYQGNIIQENLQREKITLNELDAAAREHGVDKISDVGLAVLENDGNISIVSIDTNKKTQVKRKGRKIPARLRRQN